MGVPIWLRAPSILMSLWLDFLGWHLSISKINISQNWLDHLSTLLCVLLQVSRCVINSNYAERHILEDRTFSGKVLHLLWATSVFSSIIWTSTLNLNNTKEWSGQRHLAPMRSIQVVSLLSIRSAEVITLKSTQDCRQSWAVIICIIYHYTVWNEWIDQHYIIIIITSN